jgi:phospholipid-transporting ATPase
MFSKGADSSMIPLLASQYKTSISSQSFLNSTINHMHSFAAEGLRTLVLASKVIREEEFVQWEPKYCAALNVLNDRQNAIDAGFLFYLFQFYINSRF